jgi:hypothetical protein
VKIDEIKAKLPADFEKMNFERRVEELSKLLGAPSKKWRERYPSGGGSSYAKWERPEPHDVICLETGGYDMALERGYPRLPYAGGRRFRDRTIVRGGGDP